jgi:hypothetical protein
LGSMSSAIKEQLEQRVVRAAEAALADHKYVSAIDVLNGIGFLASAHVEAWRKGRLDCLEGTVQANPKKVSFALEAFRAWAEGKGLQPSETAYLGRTREGSRPLQFSVSGDAGIERFFRTHYVSPELSDRKRKALQDRLERPPERVVFEIVRESECSECGVDLPRDSFLTMEAEKPLCLACAGLDDLEYLERGDAALTRRATKHSGKTAVVVRFSRSRGRYERQGILVEEAALQKAEEECREDAGERASARARGARLRSEQDRVLVARMMDRIVALFPGCPPEEAQAIARHTAKRGSGRVGRTAGGRNLEERPLTAAVIAAIRHNRTNYDALLAGGVERDVAREMVGDRVQGILAAWKLPARR